MTLNLIFFDHAQQTVDFIIDIFDVGHFDIHSFPLSRLSLVRDERTRIILEAILAK